MLKRMAVLMMVLVMICGVAHASETAELQAFIESHEFPEYAFEPVVLYDYTYGDMIHVIISLTDIDEEYIYLSAENLSYFNIEMHVEGYRLDDLLEKKYTEWILPFSSTTELKIDMPQNFKWLGRRSISEFGLEGLALGKKGASSSMIWGVDVSGRISDAGVETVGTGAGCVLVSDYWGSVTLMGIDYNDNYPHAIFRVENAMPFWYRDPKQVVIDYSHLDLSAEITAINGYPFTGGAGFILDGEGVGIDFVYLDGIDTVSPETGNKVRALVGRVDEMTITITAFGNGKEGKVDETYEVTVHPAEDGAVLVGDPYGWWDHRENLLYDELPDEFKEYYARQRGE